VHPNSPSDPHSGGPIDRLRLHTWLLVLGGVSIPLPLITIPQHGRFISLLRPLGLTWSWEFHVLACLAGAVAFGWVMLVPLLVWGHGWRQQCACVFALFLTLETLGILYLLLAH
jgi:hypothetical protein